METRPAADASPPAKRQRTSTHDARHVVDLTHSPPPSPPPALSIAQPGFRLTTLKNAPPAHNELAVGLNDVFCGAFSSCLLTNYMVDVPWLFGECPRLHDVPVVLVHGERDRAGMVNEVRGYDNVRLVTPRLPIPYGTHHTKMAVLVFAASVRVAIFTANFIAIDWNNKTQGIWTQEFPLKSGDADEPSGVGVVADFERDLVDYLSTLGAPVVEFCRQQVQRFDFSSAEVALIPSVPGVHSGATMHKYGHLRVKKLLEHYGAQSDNPLICQFSSLGSLDEKWLFGEFASSLMPGSTLLDTRSSAAPIKAFHIVWPSVENVRNSIEGWNAGRAIPCPLKNMKPFLHKYLRKWDPPDVLHRRNAMPHIKTYARFDPSQNGQVDWAILTSSNLSKAAWGAYQKGQTQFMIRSYELGLLFVPNRGSDGQALQSFGVIGSNMGDRFTQHDQRVRLLPLPYGFPIKTYNPREDEPWVWDVVREEPDVYGNCYIPK